MSQTKSRQILKFVSKPADVERLIGSGTWARAWACTLCEYFSFLYLSLIASVTVLCDSPPSRPYRNAALQSSDYKKPSQIYKDISGFIKNHMAEDQELPQAGRADVSKLNSNVFA